MSVERFGFKEGCDKDLPAEDIRALATQIWSREAAVEAGIPRRSLKVLFITRKTDWIDEPNENRERREIRENRRLRGHWLIQAMSFNSKIRRQEKP